jgi:hypothetical protein
VAGDGKRIGLRSATLKDRFTSGSFVFDEPEALRGVDPYGSESKGSCLFPQTKCSSHEAIL